MRRGSHRFLTVVPLVFGQGGSEYTFRWRILVRFAVVSRLITMGMAMSKARSWELPDTAVTPEINYLRRRKFLRMFGLGIAATASLSDAVRAGPVSINDSLNPAYKPNGAKPTPDRHGVVIGTLPIRHE
jgi:hypothetical protein